MSSTKRMTLPRRTQEFDISAPQSSVKKPQNRVSRIAQPVRRSTKPVGQLGENGRSRSMERGLNSALLGVPSTATKKSLNPRSMSATPQLRTPLRSVGYGGLNADNVLPMPSTVEREQFSPEARQIFDYLSQANIADLPKDFIERGNIRAMSMKQFLIIVAHLLRQIGGSRYKIGTNFIEDIMKAITELHCPFTVSKSMLKTPSAPHSIHHIITMLLWLISLAPKSITPIEWAPKCLHASEFPSQEFTQFFFQASIESFHLWNLKKEVEFGEQVEAMIDRLVSEKTNGLSQDQVRMRTEQIVKQLESIGADRTIGQTRDLSFGDVQREVSELQRVEKHLSEETKQLKKQLERQEQMYHQRQDQYYDRENAIYKVKEQLSKQEMTVSERDELRMMIIQCKNLISAKRKAIACLEEESSDYQITLSRLIKRKINCISELNTKLYNFSNAIKPEIQFEPIELNLQSNNYTELEETLLTLEQQLADVFQQYRAWRHRLSKEKCLVEQEMSDLRLMVAALESKISKQTEHFHQIQQQRSAVVRELIALADRANEQKPVHVREKELDLAILQTREQLEGNRKAIEKLSLDKQKLMEDGLERCRQALDERHLKLASFRAYVQNCEDIMKQIVVVCFSNEKEKSESV
ncbi:kinetochore protein NDC80 homolog [Anopheles nili]|uniref:kinetochore protein NDC80 homolog n=1 Tax=Anopheles nili TaxID=185578 RepID=UPI00237A944E|nr:kinetochore protein NDC80 homolog [Anopheles nili]